MKKPPLKEKFRQQLQVMLSMNVTPRKMALAWALGMLVGISPYIGFQTYIAVTLSTIFRVPLPPVIVGVYITNPFTIPFIFAATTKFGMWLLNMQVHFDINWAELSLKEVFAAGKALLVPFFIGTHVAGIVLSVFTYFLVYYIVKRYRKETGRD